MKKTKTIGIMIGILMLVIAGCSSNPTGEVVSPVKKPVVKIGVITPLTGGAAHLGEGVRNGVLLAKEELGDTTYNYEVIFEDDRLEPKMTSTAVNKLINIDQVDAIISTSSGSGKVVSPATQENKIIHFGVGSDANIAKGEYNFIHWTTPEEENRVFVKELQKRGIKRVAILQLNQQGTKAIVDDLKEKVKGTDIEIVADPIFNFGEKDFKTIILKAKEKNPEIYVLTAFSPEIEIIAKQIKELGIETPITSIEAFEFSEQPELFEGQWYVQAADPTSAYITAYVTKYGETPKLASPNGYDNFNLIVEGFERAGTPGIKPTNEEVVKELEQIKEFNGALGTLDVLGEGIVNSEAVVRMVKDGEFVTIG